MHWWQRLQHIVGIPFIDNMIDCRFYRHDEIKYHGTRISQRGTTAFNFYGENQKKKFSAFRQAVSGVNVSSYACWAFRFWRDVHYMNG